jgi:hypothetical protein
MKKKNLNQSTLCAGIISICFIFCIAAAQPLMSGPQNDLSRREIIEEAHQITGIANDTLSLIYDDSPELFQNLDDAAFTVKVVNMLCEGKNADAVCEVTQEMLGTVADKVMEDVFPKSWLSFVSAVQVYNEILQIVKKQIVVPKLENKYYQYYKNIRIRTDNKKEINDAFWDATVQSLGGGYYMMRAEMKELREEVLKQAGWRKKYLNEQSVDDFWINRFEVRYQQEQIKNNRSQVIKRIREYFLINCKGDIAALQKAADEIENPGAKETKKIETPKRSERKEKITQDRSEESILYEYRYLYREYLFAFHKGNRVEIVANAEKIGTDKYRCTHNVYCIIKDGPRKGEEYKCVSYDKIYSLSDLRSAMITMEEFLKKH